MNSLDSVTAQRTIPVSILLSVYNGAAFRAELLQSLQHQTHADGMLIGRDDGSTDQTRQIMRHFSESLESGRCLEVTQGEIIWESQDPLACCSIMYLISIALRFAIRMISGLRAKWNAPRRPCGEDPTHSCLRSVPMSDIFWGAPLCCVSRTGLGWPTFSVP